MDVTPPAFDLVAWEVPFAEAKDPSVSLITENLGQAAILVVAPGGGDNYPKYIVHFENVIALLCYEETYSFDRGYSTLTRSRPGLCAYRWTNSSWLQQYRRGAAFLLGADKGMLDHYVVFGGDSIAELIISGSPRIEIIYSKTLIKTKHEV